MPNEDPADLLSTTQAAAFLGIHRSLVPRWVEKGLLTPAHKVPAKTGTFLFTRAELVRVRDWNEARLAGPQGATA